MTTRKLSFQVIKPIWDILHKLSQVSEGLPLGIDVESLRKSTAGAVVDAGSQVLKNDAYWDSLPETISPSEEDVARARRTMEQIFESTITVPGRGEFEKTIQEYAAGESKELIRATLEKKLALCI